MIDPIFQKVRHVPRFAHPLPFRVAVADRNAAFARYRNGRLHITVHRPAVLQLHRATSSAVH